MEGRKDRIKESEDREMGSKKMSSRHDNRSCCTHELTVAVVICTRLGQPTFYYCGARDAPFLSEALLAINSCWERGVIFLCSATSGKLPLVQ